MTWWEQWSSPKGGYTKYKCVICGKVIKDEKK